MLETIAIILIVLWLLGMVSGYTLGNFIYVLLVVAIVLFLVRLHADHLAGRPWQAPEPGGDRLNRAGQ